MEKKITGMRILVVILLFLGIGIFFIANSLYGNPISAMIAKAKIKEYVEMNYPSVDAKIEQVSFSFKNGGSYSALVRSQDSIDTVFRVWWYNGDRMGDDYQSEVANLMTTLRRIDDDLNREVEKIITAQFPYQTRLVGCRHKPVLQLEECLVRDMSLDIKNPPAPIELVVWCSAESPDYVVLADRMLELRDIVDANDIPVEYYSVSVEYPYVMKGNNLEPIQWDSVGVHDFPAERLSEANLPAILEEYFIEWEKMNAK